MTIQITDSRRELAIFIMLNRHNIKQMPNDLSFNS